LLKGKDFGEKRKILNENNTFSLLSTLGQAYSELKDNDNALI